MGHAGPNRISTRNSKVTISETRHFVGSRRDHGKQGGRQQDSQTSHQSLTRVPTVKDDRLTGRLGYSFQCLGLKRSWFASVPRHVGHSTALDTAAIATIIAWRTRHTSLTQNQSIRPGAGFKHYAEAVAALRKSLDASDLTLVAVALLAHYDTVVTGSPRPSFPHVEGLAAVFQARGPVRPTQVVRAIAWTYADELFQLSCKYDRIHPLDLDLYRNFIPPVNKGDPDPDPPLQVLRALNFQLYVRLPRLNHYIRRHMRENGYKLNSKLPEDITTLALELLALEDENAETLMLRRVRVVRTEDASTCRIVPQSLQYRNFADLETLVQYWEVRLMIVELCIRINLVHARQVDTAANDVSHDSAAQTFVKTASVRLEQLAERTLINIIMSFEQGTHWALLPKDFMQALAVVWGALHRVQMIRTGVSTNFVRSWLLQKGQRLLGTYQQEDDGVGSAQAARKIFESASGEFFAC